MNGALLKTSGRKWQVQPEHLVYDTAILAPRP